MKVMRLSCGLHFYPHWLIKGPILRSVSVLNFSLKKAPISWSAPVLTWSMKVSILLLDIGDECHQHWNVIEIDLKNPFAQIKARKKRNRDRKTFFNTICTVELLLSNFKHMISHDYSYCAFFFLQQPMPWKSIFKSLPFWAILVGHTCGNYGLYMLLTQIPTYMKEVLRFDLKSVSIICILFLQ